MQRGLRFLATLGLATLGACATAKGSSKFRAGEKAYAAGELEAAKASYQDAVKAEPKNNEYKAALDKVNADIAERYANDAKAKEKAGDWKGASEAWARAAAANPADTDLEARRGLSELKAQNLGPDEWYEGVKKVSDRVPGSTIASKALAGARAKACLFHVEAGDKAVDSGEGKKALQHYDRAQQIDAAAPGLDKARYKRATALSMTEDADDKLAAGDAIAAVELYQKAYDIEALPEIKVKLTKAKNKSAAVGGKLEVARALAQKGKYADALKAYEGLTGTKGVPASLGTEIANVRASAAKDEADRAAAAAKAGDLAKAQRSLQEAMRYAELDKPQLEVVKAAIAEIQDNRPGKGVRTLEGSGVDAKAPLYVAVRAYGVAVAKKTVDKAKATAKKDSASALALLSDLGPFEDDLPAIKDLRKDLRSGNFQQLLDDALAAAKAGKDDEAANMLAAALSAGNAPQALRDAIGEANEALKGGRYADAESGFQKALAAEPKSKLAQRGLDVVRLRRKESEAKALEVVRSGKGDVAKAVEVLARALSGEPGNASAKQGAEALVGRAEAATKASDAELGALLGYAVKLTEAPVAANQAAAEGAADVGKGDLGAAETAFQKALEAAPSHKVAKLGKELAKQRMLASLKSGAKRAVQGDEASAKALAELLKKDPNDPDAKAALQKILDEAKALAEKGSEGEAAKKLELAAVATSPAPGVKVALDKANKAFGASKLEEAEKAYGDVLDLEAEHAVGKLGLELAKAARVKALSAAVADAKKGGGNVEQAKEALKRTLAINPDGPEARKAFADLLDEAKAQGEGGNDRQASALLDAANVVSKPETTRNAIGEANKLLADGKHVEAKAAYEGVLAGADSRVATAGKEIAHKRRIAILKEGALELKKGGDVERGAKATAELLELDATNADAKAAIDGAMREAERLAASGDDKGAVKLLRAAARAAKEAKDLEGGLIRFESGKLDDAAKELERSNTDLARRMAALVKARKLGTLKAGLSGDDRAKAESIKALLASDPNNKEAQAAFNQLLEKAKAAAAKGDAKGAGDALQSATIASAAPEKLAAALDGASTKLGEKKYAEAERGFIEALELSKDSKVAKTGLELAKKARLQAERDALSAIAKLADPTEPAKVLLASLVVEPSSKAVEDAKKQLLERAKRSAAKADDGDTARSLDAAVLLETGSTPPASAQKASEALGKGSFEEAEKLYASLAAGKDEDETAKGAKPSKVAATGVELARVRRVMLLRGELEAAKKENDVLRQSNAVQKILELDKADKGALDASKRLKGSVIESRVQSAKQQKEFGKLGAAYVYMKRAVDLDPANAKNKAELASLEAALKKQLDLVVLVDKVARATELDGAACKGIETAIRAVASDEGAAKKDLGAYLLPSSWLELADAKDARTPAINGALKVKLEKCTNDSAVGAATTTWELVVPPEDGSKVVGGTLTVELPSGVIVRDEQDAEGENAKKALGKRIGKAIVEKLGGDKGAVEAWLLVLAEHGMAKKDAALAADAWARLTIKKTGSLDPARIQAVEKYLEAELK